jgi:hypothetical protein
MNRHAELMLNLSVPSSLAHWVRNILKTRRGGMEAYSVIGSVTMNINTALTSPHPMACGYNTAAVLFYGVTEQRNT